MAATTSASALWGIGLILAAVVLVVVAALLTIILRTAIHIDNGAKQIWVVGKSVANSTIQLSRLRQTNQVVADILESAGGILRNAGRIAAHAQTCGGCPACVTASPGPASATAPTPHVDPAAPRR